MIFNLLLILFLSGNIFGQTEAMFIKKRGGCPILKDSLGQRNKTFIPFNLAGQWK